MRKTLLLLLLLCPPLIAATLEEGYDAIERGNSEEGIAIWRQLAEQGNQTAQLNLGQIYRLGAGVPASDEEAVKWYLLAAQQGSGTARYNLALMYDEGRASQADLNLAFAQQSSATDIAKLEQSTEPEEEPSAPNDDWIARLPADTHLLQLLGSSNRSALEDYRSQHLERFQPPARIVATQMKQRDWYLLFIGPFDTNARAKSAIAALPAPVKAQQPWVRSTGSVQAMRPVE